MYQIYLPTICMINDHDFLYNKKMFTGDKEIPLNNMSICVHDPDKYNQVSRFFLLVL